MNADSDETGRCCQSGSRTPFGGNGTGPATGFELEHVPVVNRAPGKPIAQVVYDKLKVNSVIVDELGPDTLMAELRKVWEKSEAHIEVAKLLDWFASHVYLPRLRHDATLTLAIEKLIGKIDSPVAFAQKYDETSGGYEGVSLWTANLGTGLSSGLLVWWTALPEPKTTDGRFGAGRDQSGNGKPDEPDRSGASTRDHRPRRFYGSITLDPDKAGLQVAKIAEEILFELSRPNGASLKLTLEIEGAAKQGYPDDVIDVVRSNIRDLKLNVSEAGFEKERSTNPTASEYRSIRRPFTIEEEVAAFVLKLGAHQLASTTPGSSIRRGPNQLGSSMRLSDFQLPHLVSRLESHFTVTRHDSRIFANVIILLHNFYAFVAFSVSKHVPRISNRPQIKALPISAATWLHDKPVSLLIAYFPDTLVGT